MPSIQESFELRVDITGICLFVRRRGSSVMRILMPDGRATGGALQHPDQSPAIPHAGYMRFDLANTNSNAANTSISGAKDTPQFEVVHLFDREELRFGIDDDGDLVDDRELSVPTFSEFAPQLKLLDDLGGPNPARELLMRTELYGGTLTCIRDAIQWDIPDLDPAGKTRRHWFGGQVRWTRMIQGRDLTLRILKFDGSGVAEIRLRPTTASGDKPAILIKLANLCAADPLEWGNLGVTHPVAPDVDFKWLYHLMQPRPDCKVPYPPRDLPHPLPVRGKLENATQDCFPGIIDG